MGCTRCSRLASDKEEIRSGCVGAGGGGGGATSIEDPTESNTPCRPVPVPPSTPRLLTSGEDAIDCSCSSAIVSGIVAGVCIWPLRMLDERIALCSCATGAGAGGGVRIGASSNQCRLGGPCTINKGIISNKLSPKACMVKDASVVHLRRGNSSHVLSSVLNILSDIACPPVRARNPTDTWAWQFDPERLGEVKNKNQLETVRDRKDARKVDTKIKTASARGLVSLGWEPKLSRRCRYFFGGVLGAAGFAAGFAAGLGGVLPAAGAGTPDCTLKASITGWVMSTAGPYQITGP